ncbi:unnamed protein product [Dovyalis caffra]|uniref:Uncharacterized protein n=1 Tax=Dovyalis caffra TaxID=77055 RepID=A0AAV1RG02_9ROSI|nr:unnamed protein product [Dovyalis caffra]
MSSLPMCQLQDLFLVYKLRNQKNATFQFLQVKVRKQEEDDEFSPPNDHESMLSSKVITESLSVEGCFSHASEKGNRSDSSPSVARIAKPYFVSNLKTQPVPAIKGKLKDNKRTGESNKLRNLRAQSALRPRAVLSSPDNDGMIGKRNKWKNERTLTLKSCNSELKKPAETMVTANQGKSESPLNIRKGFKVPSPSKNTGALKQKGLSKFSSPATKSIL